jgi:hypothetical protein
LERLTAKAKIASPGFDPGALCDHQGIYGAADEAELNVVNKSLADLVVIYTKYLIFLTGSKPNIYPAYTEPTQNN